ncbi:MAG: DSD1 family PLP-dependent enzyme [Chloroflexota bacterium]
MNLVLGRRLEELDTPVLCVGLPAMEANLARMAAFFAGRPASLRPHIKTHKCPALAHRQMAAGAIGVTCAKLGEAEVMAQAGIDDILIANQIVGRPKVTRLVELAARTRVMVAVDDAANVAELDAAAQARGVCLRLLVEVDIGMGRCGVQPGEPALALARRVGQSPGLRFEGLMGYEGHTVMIPDFAERKQRAEAAMRLLLETRDVIQADGLAVHIVSGGATGTYDITGDYPGVTEVQAGSYITMDTQYREVVGIDFAYAMFAVAQVVSTPRPGVAIVDAGLKTLTRDFGLPLVAEPAGWRLVRLSEEHGFLERDGGPALRIGDRVRIWPNHGCTTANLHDALLAVREDRVEAVWPIAGRGKIR